jgi:hypothetical protein
MNKLQDKTYLFTFILIILLIVIIFPFIFSYRLISGGDYTYLSNTYLQYLFHNSFSSWISTYNFGQNVTALLNYAPYNFLIGVTAGVLQWNGILIERIFWWIPFFILAFVSHFYLGRLVPVNRFGFLSTFIFLFNTYTLMLLGGGQISGVGMAYVLMPIVLVSFIELINRSGIDLSEKVGTRFLLKKSLLCGLLFSLQAIFDLRFAYVTLWAIGLYALLKLTVSTSKKNVSNIFPFLLFVFITPLGVTGLIHSFWLLPTLIFHQNPIAQGGAAFSSVQAVKYFSFAKLENTLSLIHPYWPNNVFGEVSFMRWQFLLLPIIAFSSLLFLKEKKKENFYIIFFVLLAILGAFLSKGANDPFGSVYVWMFQHIPGFILFRDPTKWYVLQITAYCVLIPSALFSISELIKKHIKGAYKNMVPHVLLGIFVLYILILIYPALFGRLTGTFISQPMPQEYQQLNAFISSQNSYFRTLWLPTRQKYGIYSVNHPAISANDFFQIYSPKDLLKKISDKQTQTILQDSAIRYIIIPDDTDGTIFVTDRKFDKKQYELFVTSLEKVPWLKEVADFGNNKVFAVSSVKDHFWSSDRDIQIQPSEISPTKYSVNINNGKKGQLLVFSEQFDPLWKTQMDNKVITSTSYEKLYNSFVLPKNGDYSINVYYQPQSWIPRSILISIAIVIIIIGLLVIL